VVNAQEVNRAPSQSLEQALQGKVLGAQINMNSGAPGGGGQIQVRGVTSVLGNGQPLVVVDGVIFSNESYSSGANTVTGATSATPLASTQDAVVNRLADLNPQEIESIEILKSAAATALYGSRATNGVVVIRTKRGAPGQTRTNLTQRVGTQNMLRKLGHRKFSDVETVVDLPYGNGGNEQAVAYLNSAFPNGTIPASANIDLEGEFYNNSRPSYETNLNISGGTERTQFFSAVTNRNEQGLAPRTGAELLAGRFNIDHGFSSRLRASLGTNVTRNVLRRGLSNNDNTGTSPVYLFGYTPAVIDLRQRNAETGTYTRNPFNGGGNAVGNPFETFSFLRYTENVLRTTGSGNLTYTAVESPRNRLTLTLQGGYDRFNQGGDLFSPAFLQFEGNDTFFGRAGASTIDQTNYNYFAAATHVLTPGRIGSFTTSVTGGYEQQGADITRIRARGIQPGITNPFVSGAAQVTDQTGDAFVFRDQFVNVGEQVLAFGERLALNAGVRVDRSSANGDREQWYAWPRVSGSFLVNTPFVPRLDNVKFRAGWGNTGNRPRFTDRFLLLQTGTSIGGQTTLERNPTVNNPSIKPERLTETEVGADFVGFGQRVTFEATYYDRTITDLLFTAPVAPTTGFTQAVINSGELKNEGVELGMNLIPVQTRSVTWTSRTGFTRNRQAVEKLPTSVPRFNVPGSFGAPFGRNAIVAGQRTTYIFGNIPVNPTTGEALPRNYFALNPSAVAGTDYAVRDTVGGDANPQFTMFFNNSVNVGRFTVSAVVDWRKGGDVVNMTNLLFDEGGNSRDYDNASPVASQSLGEFRYAAWNNGNDYRAYQQKGTNVRLREVQLAYDVPQAFARRLRANTMNVSLQGRNLLMATKYWGYDPEFNNFGNTNLNRFIDLAPFPSVRQFSFQVNLAY
jgi:TonB-linked SusC/RagA family outer membrane protein